MTTSRINPKTREIMVIRLIINVDLRRNLLRRLTSLTQEFIENAYLPVCYSILKLPRIAYSPPRIDKCFQDKHSDAPSETNRSITLANIASAKKRARQSENRRQQNATNRSMLRTSLKKVATVAQTKDKKAITEAINTAAPLVDRMARKGLIHKNKAARHKHQMNELLRSL